MYLRMIYIYVYNKIYTLSKSKTTKNLRRMKQIVIVFSHESLIYWSLAFLIFLQRSPHCCCKQHIDASIYSTTLDFLAMVLGNSTMSVSNYSSFDFLDPKLGRLFDSKNLYEHSQIYVIYEEFLLIKKAITKTIMFCVIVLNRESMSEKI